jgi:hypothetical protein
VAPEQWSGPQLRDDHYVYGRRTWGGGDHDDYRKLRDLTGLELEDEKTLVAMNDGEPGVVPRSFEDIAKWIERNVPTESP